MSEGAIIAYVKVRATLAMVAGGIVVAGGGILLGRYVLPSSSTRSVVPSSSTSRVIAPRTSPSTSSRAITSMASATATAGSVFSFNVSTTGSPTATLAEQGTLPTGMTFANNGNGTATLFGTPGAKTGGLHLLVITATFGTAAVSQLFSLTVNAVPIITSKATLHATDNVAFAFTVQTGYGYPSPPAISDSTLPTGVSIDDLGNGTAVISGTLTTGSYVSTIDATNSTGSGSQTFIIVVKM
ncbi:MAG TPA: putative Ig domain-containing protein [Acidimicrobiales bacterium]|nr:putative Ig domain-containing protein [Acidimicrobiales bacterium]